MKAKMKMSSIKNIILISKNIQKMKSDTIPGTPSKSVSLYFWRFVPLFVRLPMPRFLSHPYFKMLGCKTRADVATLPRRDLETSRRCHVVTWRRRNVETSRRGSHLHALFFIAPKTASTAALFAPLYLYSKQTPNHESSHKNCINNIK